MQKQKREIALHTKREILKEYVYVLIGAAIVAITFNVFLLPNRVASGGVSGISTILDAVIGWEPAYVQWASNIPLFMLVWCFLASNSVPKHWSEQFSCRLLFF